jgi:hypothetical protein
MGTDKYYIHLSIVDEDTRRLELEAPHPMIRHLLESLLDTMATSQNGATPGPRADPPPPPAVKRRRYRKRAVTVPHSEKRKSLDKLSSDTQPQLARKCAFCSNPFVSPHSGQLYCSQACKAKAHSVQPLPSLQAPDL